jgi:antitoxin (DNA-binding transcriptional repressor) of toxin-antitoxin stability system
VSKTITVEELAANVDDHIAEVQRGETLMVTAAGKPVAKLGPTTSVDDLIRRRPTSSLRFQDVDVGPRPKNLRSDAAQMIIAERDHERSEKRWRS